MFSIAIVLNSLYCQVASAIHHNMQRIPWDRRDIFQMEVISLYFGNGPCSWTLKIIRTILSEVHEVYGNGEWLLFPKTWIPFHIWGNMTYNRHIYCSLRKLNSRPMFGELLFPVLDWLKPSSFNWEIANSIIATCNLFHAIKNYFKNNSSAKTLRKRVMLPAQGWCLAWQICKHHSVYQQSQYP